MKKIIILLVVLSSFGGFAETSIEPLQVLTKKQVEKLTRKQVENLYFKIAAVAEAQQKHIAIKDEKEASLQKQLDFETGRVKIAKELLDSYKTMFFQELIHQGIIPIKLKSKLLADEYKKYIAEQTAKLKK